MFNLKKASFSLAVAMLVATTGTLFSTTAQAAIMGGQISGIWQHDGDGEGGFNVGDLFTADYTYDSDSISTYDYSDNYNSYFGYDYYDKYLVTSISLLSLVFNSGAISQIFDFSNEGYSSLLWIDIQYNPDLHGQNTRKMYALSAYDPSLTQNYFEASTTSGQDYYGSPLSYSSASAGYRSHHSTTSFTTYTYTRAHNNVTFSAPFLVPPSEPTVSTPEPTSALLTGLIGLGVMVLHRRKKIEAAAE